MKFNTLEEWYEFTLLKAQEYNTIWKPEFSIEDMDYPLYTEILALKEQEIFIKLSNSFKTKILSIINNSALNYFNDCQFKHFFLIRLAIVFNLQFKYQYYELSLPFGKDVSKYEDRAKTICKQGLKENIYYKVPKSPKDCLTFFKQKCNDKFLDDYNFNHLTNSIREKNRDKNILIDELIEAIVIDNYINDKHFSGTIRITDKSKKLYTKECKLILNQTKVEIRN